MALRGRRHWLAIDGLGGPSYKFPQFLAASGIPARTSCAMKRAAILKTLIESRPSPGGWKLRE